MVRIAFDIGGTFTDFALQADDGGDLRISKVPTTPRDPAIAVLDGLAVLLAEASLSAADIETALHATTIATNAIIERKGRPTALLTTRGFRDVLIVGRQKRYDIFDLYMEKPVPLVPRSAILEVDERLGPEGEVIVPLDMESVDRAIDRALEKGVEAVAVALLHAYASDAHEALIARRIEERAPGLDVAISSAVSPKYREYERANTTVANAYIKPIVRGYIANLERSLTDRGFEGELFIMQSNGGLVSPALATEHPVRIVESGPAAGVLMGAIVGREEGFEHVITFDMGGTTAKLGAVDHGEPATVPTFEVDMVRFLKGSGLPLNISSVELLEIGAGGGSIAGIEMGLIKVGPESAGADPGPICYGQGGARPTVTDANLVLGYLNPDYFNGGALALDAVAARAGIEAVIATPLSLSIDEAAWGIHAIVNSNMERAMRIVSVERGRDPRRYTLIAFGGAGPVHAARIARALGIPKVLVPRAAGVGSAVGLLQADAKLDVSLTRVLRLTPDSSREIAAIYEDLGGRIAPDLGRFTDDGQVLISRHAYMRFAGQGYEVKVELPQGDIEDGYAAAAIQAFQSAYASLYGYTGVESAVEAVDWYLAATVPTGAAHGTAPTGADSSNIAPGTERQVYFGEMGGSVPCPVLRREAIAPGGEVRGPAIIEEGEATTVVLPGDVARLTGRGHLLIEIGEGGEA